MLNVVALVKAPAISYLGIAARADAEPEGRRIEHGRAGFQAARHRTLLESKVS